MKLGMKVLLVIFLTWTLMVGAAYFGSTKILEKGYIQLEDQQQAKDLNQVHEVINAFLANNDINLKGWAVWDEMYQYAANHNQKFIDENVTPASLANFYIDLFLIYDVNGVPLFVKELNSDRSQFLPLPKEVAQLFQTGGALNRLVTLPETGHDVVGLVFVPSRGILGFASRRILNSAGGGPAHGTDISVQYINDTVLLQFRKQSKLDILLYTLPQIKANAELNHQLSALLAKGKDDARVDQSEKTLFLYTILRDVNHHPIGMIKVIVPRTIRMAGAKTVFYFNVALIITGIIFAILLFYLLRVLVIKRLEKINTKITKVIANNDFTLQVPQKGTDELSSLGKEMNKMLSTIASVEAILTDTINSMPSILAIIDKETRITNLNFLAEKELGIASEAAKGKSLLELFPYLIPYKDKLTEAMKNKQVQEIDKITDNQNENTRYLHVLIFPLSHSGEKTIAVRIDDISERIKADEHFMQSDKLASVGILTAGVAYEINDPIHLIFNAVDPLKKNVEVMLTLLKQYKKTGESENFSSETNLSHIVQETNQLLQTVFDSANFTAHTVRDLQAFSRLEEDSVKRTNIHLGIDSALVILRHNYKDRIEIIKQYGKIAEIECFPGKINQVFMNIILNAIDSIPDRGKITICTEQTDGTVKISIKDTGTGIEKENSERIFDPFFTTKDSKRTGLGLSISSTIIHDHHGTIQVKSEVKKGTEIIVILPINQPEL